MPLQPNWPCPVLGGMNAPSGLPAVTQLDELTNQTAAAMKARMIATLMTTMTSLTRADSRIPTISSSDVPAVASMAGTFITAVVRCH